MLLRLLTIFLDCPYANALLNFVSLLFSMNIMVAGSPMDMLLAAMDKSLISQVFCLWNAAIVAVFNTIWYVCNHCLHSDSLVSISRAFIIGKAIQETNFLHTGYIQNTVSDLMILKCLRIAVKRPMAHYMI